MRLEFVKLVIAVIASVGVAWLSGTPTPSQEKLGLSASQVDHVIQSDHEVVLAKYPAAY